MRNPLIKRLPRELKADAGKYLVLFIFIAGMISIISGFLVAGTSMSASYDESFEKYNIEDGNFELAWEADEGLLAELEKEAVTVYENFYVEEETKEIDSTLRVFIDREEVNKVCLMEGEMPQSAAEIAIDRLYASNNGIGVGDTLTVGNTSFTVSGTVALSDYSCLYQSTSDMIFDATLFGVAVVTEEAFENLGDAHLHYSYSWKYDKAPAGDAQEKEMSEAFLEVLAQKAIVMNFIPRYVNQAIVFAGNDIGRDGVFVMILLYIVMAIIAFVFAITTNNTIAKEAAVIGTLRASGYTKGELVVHYLTMPMLVTLLSALVGNVLGYTVMEDFASGMYYNSYCLPTYVVLWNASAFVKTTVVPLAIMFLINLLILVKKLQLSPLRFIRRDLSIKKKKKAFRLNTGIKIMTRFRLRVIFQNMPNYITIIVGMFFANTIMLFGSGMEPLMDHYQEEITSNMISEYQYLLKLPAETQTENAEKFSAQGMKTIEGKLRSEDITVYGIVQDSLYIDLDVSGNKVYISNAYAEKHGIEEGDTFTIKESYGDTEYSFKVEGIYYYPAGLAVFMEDTYFKEVFDMEEESFTGYFSNEEITDIDKVYIASEITEEDLTKTSRQMKLSMGGMMFIFQAFGIVMFMLIIYLLSKIVIEKNAQSISMTKILGYSSGEINSLYIRTTTVVVIASLLLTLPVVNFLMEYIMFIAFSEYAGYLPYYVPMEVFVENILLGIGAYAVIAFFQTRRVKKVPMDMALKNVE
ncbi:MAG: ABC transporter permease [Lachnospiraceae bacterium]|nr:ABC transporter permease [Lachnospiraceae bacterium]